MSKRTRSGKYNWEELGKDYESGLSLNDLERKYGVSPGHASRIIKKIGIKPHEMGYKKEVEWRQLVRTGHRGAGLLVNIPKHLIKTAGFDPNEELLGKWIVREGVGILLTLKSKNSPLQDSSQKVIE